MMIYLLKSMMIYLEFILINLLKCMMIYLFNLTPKQCPPYLLNNAEIHYYLYLSIAVQIRVRNRQIIFSFLNQNVFSNKKDTSDFHGTVSFDQIKMSQQKKIPNCLSNVRHTKDGNYLILSSYQE